MRQRMIFLRKIIAIIFLLQLYSPYMYPYAIESYIPSSDFPAVLPVIYPEQKDVEISHIIVARNNNARSTNKSFKKTLPRHCLNSRNARK